MKIRERNRLRRAASPAVKRLQAWDAEHACARRAGAVRVESADGRAARFIWTRLVAKSRLPPGARLIAHTLVLHGRADGSDIYPSTATLAAEAGCSERVVCVHLATLARSGWIWREPRGSGTKWAGTLYTLCAPQTRLEAFSADPAPWVEDPSWTPEQGTERGSVPRGTDETSVGETAEKPTDETSVRTSNGEVTQGDGTDVSANGTDFSASGTDVSAQMALTIRQSSLSSKSVRESVSTACADAHGPPGTETERSPPRANPESKIETPAETAADRIEKLRKAIIHWPEGTDEEIQRCVAGATLGEVRRARGPIP